MDSKGPSNETTRAAMGGPEGLQRAFRGCFKQCEGPSRAFRGAFKGPRDIQGSFRGPSEAFRSLQRAFRGLQEPSRAFMGSAADRGKTGGKYRPPRPSILPPYKAL
jgi:hypothetical protein